MLSENHCNMNLKLINSIFRISLAIKVNKDSFCPDLSGRPCNIKFLIRKDFFSRVHMNEYPLKEITGFMLRIALMTSSKAQKARECGPTSS